MHSIPTNGHSQEIAPGNDTGLCTYTSQRHIQQDNVLKFANLLVLNDIYHIEKCSL